MVQIQLPRAGINGGMAIHAKRDEILFFILAAIASGN